MKKRVLVVGEDLLLRAKVARAVQSAGFAVELAGSRGRAVKLATTERMEAAVVMIGRGRGGPELAQEISAAVPRMILVADPTDEAILPAHSLVADAVVLAPFEEQELRTRLIEVMASRGGGGEGPVSDLVFFEGCWLDLAGHSLVDRDGREVMLTRSELALLTTFVRNPNRVLSREQLRHAVAGRGTEPYERAIDVLVGRVRRKIEPDPQLPQLIATVHGAGYKFTARAQGVDANRHTGWVIGSEQRVETKAISLDRSGHGGAERIGQHGAGTLLPHNDPEMRQLTVLSCGLAGTLGLAAESDLEDLSGAIRGFRHASCAAIARMGGLVARLTNAEVLALFGYVRAQEDDAERAVHAGLYLVKLAGRLRLLQVQVAIASGLVLVGGENELVGAPPMVAAWLRSTAPPNSVLVTVSTHKLLANVFEYEEYRVYGPVLGPVAYRITGTRAVGTHFEARRRLKLPPPDRAVG